jgi:hypothetical protein
MWSTLWRPVSRGLMFAVSRLSFLIPKPDDEPRGFAPGKEPDRILIFGNAAAEGWGSTSHQDALPGQLAIAISAITGRGAETELVTDSTLDITNAEERMAEVKLWWFDGVLITLGMTDAFALLPAETWRARMGGLLEQTVKRTPPNTPVLVTGIFSVRRRPVNHGELRPKQERHGEKLNSITEELCAMYPDVHYVLPGAVKLGGDYRTVFADLYRGAARDTAEILAPLLIASGSSDRGRDGSVD